MHFREEKKMNNELEASQEKFKKILGTYVKHAGLEIELTLKNGNKLVIAKKRQMQGDFLIQTSKTGSEELIPIQEIQKADIYAV